MSKFSLIVAAVGLAVCCGQLLAVQSAPIEAPSSEVRDLQKLGDVLRKLETARRQGSKTADVDHYDLSQVVQVLERLDEDDLKFVENELPMLNTLFKALSEHLSSVGDEHDVHTWSDLCDESCASATIQDYLAKRPEKLDSFVVHQLDNTKVERLANGLLKRAGAEQVTDELIHGAVQEFQELADDFASVGSHTLRLDLYYLEKAVDYFERFSGRAVSAMWPDYQQRVEYENFADIFREQFYEMLHQNGYGIRQGLVVEIPKSGKTFVV